MDEFHFLLFLPGLMIGLLVWTRIFQLLLAFVGIKYGMHKPPPSDAKSLRKQLLALTVFICTWLVVFVGLAYYFRQQAGSAGWPWFLLGIAATPCMVVPFAFSAWRRAKRQS